MFDLTKNKQAFLNLPKPKAVIFDWDNTLVDTWPLIHEAIDSTMVAMNREPWGFEKVRNNIHKSMRESFPEIFGDEWQKAGEVYKSSYRANHLEKLQLLPGALDLLNKLQEKGILQFVISNKIGVTLRKEIKKLAVEDKFFSVVGSMDATSDKPSKAPVDLALMGSGLDPKKDQIWFIGDTIADVHCAQNSACCPVVFNDVEGQVSPTISAEELSGVNNNGKSLPLYFDHQELVKLISKF